MKILCPFFKRKGLDYSRPDIFTIVGERSNIKFFLTLDSAWQARAIYLLLLLTELIKLDITITIENLPYLQFSISSVMSYTK